MLRFRNSLVLGVFPRTWLWRGRDGAPECREPYLEQTQNHNRGTQPCPDPGPPRRQPPQLGQIGHGWSEAMRYTAKHYGNRRNRSSVGSEDPYWSKRHG